MKSLGVKMTSNIRCIITQYSFFKSLFLLTCFLSFPLTLTGQDAAEPERKFDGFYAGASIGVQNIFGGALIDNLDLLAQKSGLVFESSLGYRRQFLKGRLLLGIALQFGVTDGDLTETDARSQAQVTYKNSTQGGYGLTLGAVVGKVRNVLLYTYLNNTRRNFDIQIVDSGTTITQTDGQVFVRYGIGAEIPLFRKLNIRASIGGISNDYGDLIVSQKVDDKMDFNLGVLYQF